MSHSWRRRREVSIRREVNWVLLTEPGRDLRGTISGAATGSEVPRRGRREQERRLATQALEGAISSAVASAKRAIRTAASR